MTSDQAPASSGFLSDLIETLTKRSRALLGRGRSQWAALARNGSDLTSLGELLLSRRGEASGVAMAEALLASYARASQEEKVAFLEDLAAHFGADREQVARAVAEFTADGISFRNSAFDCRPEGKQAFVCRDAHPAFGVFRYTVNVTVKQSPFGPRGVQSLDRWVVNR